VGKVTDDKTDSSQFSDLYTALIAAIPLLPQHREQLKTKRGFNDETIDRLQFRSCHESLRDKILELTARFSARELRQAGIFVNDYPNPKLLKDNVLIPFLECTKITAVKPHKNAFAGFAIRPYIASNLASFVIIAESEFKAAAATQLGYPAIGLTGVSSFSGKHFPMLCDMLKTADVTTICIIFDNEVKDNPAYPNFKKYFWERWDTQFYAFLMAKKLEEQGFEATVATLPDSWNQNGKADIDGGLAMGKVKESFDPVVKSRLHPDDYLKSLPGDARLLATRMYAKWNNHFPVRALGSRYMVFRGKGDDQTEVAVSNFELTIENNIYTADGECRREVTLENDVGDRVSRAVFEGEHFSHYQAFRKRCLGLGNFQFTGTQTDLQHIVGLETAREIGKKVYQPDHVGWVKGGDIYLFGNCGVSKTGERLAVDDDGVIWLGLTGYQAISLQQGADEDRAVGIPRLWPEDTDPEALIKSIEENFGGYMGVRLACSWLIATLFSHQLSTLYGSAFPMLFVSGQAESGKSTLCRWLSAMAGVQTEGNSYWSGTLVGFQRSIAYYSSLPLWLDEFRNSNENSIRAKEGFFRSAYDGQMSLKGLRQAFGVRGATVRGRLMVSGQDTPSDLALQQRCVTIRLSHKNRGEQYADLNARVEQFSGIIPPLVKRFAARRAAVVKAVHTMREHLRNCGLDDRTAITYAIVVGTYDGLIKENDKQFLDFCVTHAKESFAEKESEKPSKMFLEGILTLKARNMLNGNMVRTVGGNVAIYMPGVMPMFREMLRRGGDDVSFKVSTMMNEFEESECFVEKNKQVRFGKGTLRCLVLDATKDDLVRSIYEVAAGGEE
jgi:DNA primase